ncbi:O-antigen ligase family protein [Bradyrhizobium sp.]
MSETVNRELNVSLSTVLSAWHDPAARILNVDLLTVLMAIMLPWSTSGVAIAGLLWVFALIPTLELRPFLVSLKRPISALPIALFGLALVGTLWSDAAWGARLYAVGPTLKLLALPLLFYHFERSPRGIWVFVAFLGSCTLLMAVSFAVAVDPNFTLKPEAAGRGIFVKNYIDQSQEFALCAVALAYPIMVFVRSHRLRPAALLAAVALGLIANMVFVVASRTTLVTLPLMLMTFALLHLHCRTVIALLCVAALVVAAAWLASPNLRRTASTFISDYQYTQERNNPTGLGSRLEYWQKSLDFFRDAPLIGHGSGATEGLFEQAAIGETGVQAEIVRNPHNQTLNVAVQWGVIGVAVLTAMWLVHLLLFRGDGLMTWIGLLAVVQNILTSLFNSHLFDFVEGWMYVLGVGIAGGTTLAARRLHGPAPLPAASCWQAIWGRAAGSVEAGAGKRVTAKILGAFALIAALACGVVFFLNYWRTPPADPVLAQDINAMKAALSDYHASRGTYPVATIPLVDMKSKLSRDGFLVSQSIDFSAVDKDALYWSVNGKSYGLRFQVNRSADNPAGTECVVQVGRSYLGGLTYGRPACVR